MGWYCCWQWWSSFTGGTVANATTFSSDATVDGTLAVGDLSMLNLVLH